MSCVILQICIPERPCFIPDCRRFRCSTLKIQQVIIEKQVQFFADNCKLILKFSKECVVVSLIMTASRPIKYLLQVDNYHLAVSQRVCDLLILCNSAEKLIKTTVKQLTWSMGPHSWFQWVLPMESVHSRTEKAHKS